MAGKKFRKLVLWLLCALMLLGACGQAAGEGKAVERAELLHVCSGEDNETCLAASADGTRFLVCRNNHPLIDLWIQDADGGSRKDLFLAGMTEEEAKNILEAVCAGEAARIKSQDRKAVQEKLVESRKTQYGTYPNALIRTVWQAPLPQYVKVAGDYVLLQDPQAPASARINMQTGETVLLYMASAWMAGDGTVLCRGAGSSGIQDLYLLPPDQAVPEQTAPLQLPDSFYPVDYSLQKDRTVWILGAGEMEKVEKDGRKIFFRDYSLFHCDSSGAVLCRIDAGKFNMSLSPSHVLYSERTGIGVVYSNMMAGGDLWIFGPEDDTLKPLVLESMMPPALRPGERNEVLDEYGMPTAVSRPLCVLGLSEGGTKLLVQDYMSRYLLSLDLRTLKADILMTASEIVSFAEGHSAVPGPGLESASWTGRNIISGGRAVSGCAIRIPFPVED